MKIQLTNKSDHYIASSDAKGAYYACADALLLAVHKSVYGIGTLIGRYQDGKFDRRKLAY